MKDSPAHAELEFFREMEEWIEHAAYRSDADVTPLRKAAIKLAVCMGAQLPLTLVGPLLGALYFAMIEYEHPWWKRGFMRAWVWLCEHTPPLRGRPLWNDFRMCLWQLSRDPRYVAELHRHIARARRKRNAMQFESAAWMIGSVCQQDPEFAEHWADCIGELGDVFAGVPL